MMGLVSPPSKRSSVSTSSRTARPWLWALLALSGIGSAGASEWQLVGEESTVTMYVVKQGATVSGVFKTFTAAIAFDPADPGHGSIVGVVETGSIDTRDAQNDTYVHTYLETEEFPEARYESTAIEPIPGGFRAEGVLTLKGISRPMPLDFAFDTGTSDTGETARFRAGMTVNRFDFDIASDVDLNFAGQDVYVQIELTLAR